MTANKKRRIGESGGDLRGFRSQTWRVRREPRRGCRGTENRQGCVEACNCLRNGEKRQNPEGVSRRGSALTKNRQSWRIEIWLPGTDSNRRPSGYKCPDISTRLGLSHHPSHIPGLRVSGASPGTVRSTSRSSSLCTFPEQ